MSNATTLNRRVIVFSNSNGERIVLENCAYRTWGELEAYLMDEKGINTSRLDAVVRSTRVTLQVPEAALPITEFTVILVEREMKSGAKLGQKKKSKKEDVRGFIDTLTQDELVIICNKINTGNRGSQEVLAKRVKGKQYSMAKPLTIKKIKAILATDVELYVSAAASEAVAAPAVEELQAASEAVNSNPTPESDTISPEDALVEVDEILNKAQEDVIAILGKVRSTVTKALEGVDPFLGCEEEAAEIKASLKY